MKFCTECGTPVEFKIPPDDTLPRHICPNCQTIHYQNPKLVVGSIAEWEGRILLCRRAIEPGYGLWTLPAGFMENGESTAQAAERETREEACARVAVEDLFSLVNIPHIDQVHLFYRARLLDPEVAPGTESLDTALLDESAIPWEDIAFRSVALSLRQYLDDRRRGRFEFHETCLTPPPAG